MLNTVLLLRDRTTSLTFCPLVQPQNALLSESGDVRYGYLGLLQGLGRASRRADGEGAPDTSAADVNSIAVLLYRMCTGEQMLPRDLGSSLEKIDDPLKRELMKHVLFATTPLATELTQIIAELSPFDIRQFSNATRALLDVENRTKAASAEEAKRRATTRCVMICEPGNGVDCETSLVLLKALRDLGHVEPLGVIANSWPSSERARLARGTLDTLGMRDVPVGVGSEGTATATARVDRSWDSAESYSTPSFSERGETIVTGQRLLRTVFQEARPASITLLCTSSLKDAAIFLRDSGALSVVNSDVSAPPL